MIAVALADNSILAREGFKSLVRTEPIISVVAEIEKSETLIDQIKSAKPDVLVIDYCAAEFGVDDIVRVKNAFPEIKVLAISSVSDPAVITNAMNAGINSHVLKHCSQQEIIDALQATVAGNKFFCSTLLGYLDNTPDGPGCAGVNLSPREIEIIGHIADGLTNKEIADHVCLSAHTVMTHRKNIMAKLGINNTAGIVIFAVKQNIVAPNKYLYSPE